MNLERSSLTGILLAAVFVGGCESPTGSGTTVDSPSTTHIVSSDADRLADLGIARIRDIRIRTSERRRLLAFSTIIVNVGAGSFELHGRRGSMGEERMGVVQRIYDDLGTWREIATEAVMELGGDGHDHWHVRDLQRMELIRLDNGARVGTSAKRGFCFWDNWAHALTLPGAPSSEVYGEDGCGDGGSLSTVMGLSIGWGDIYTYRLPDQNVDITGLGSGRYRLVVIADPFKWFAESDETNNTTWVDLQLQGGGRKVRVLGYGPGA